MGPRGSRVNWRLREKEEVTTNCINMSWQTWSKCGQGNKKAEQSQAGLQLTDIHTFVDYRMSKEEKRLPLYHGLLPPCHIGLCLPWAVVLASLLKQEITWRRKMHRTAN
jgi:hypothetical protein